MQRSYSWQASIAAAGAVLVFGSPVIAQKASTTNGSTAQSGSNNLQLPDTPVWLGSVRLPSVKADGKALAAGTYRVRLTGEHATDKAVGQSPQLERWVEFLQGNQVKGRALAPVVPAPDARMVAESSIPARGTVRAERLKGDDYYRLWFNHRGEQILIYLPLA